MPKITKSIVDRTTPSTKDVYVWDSALPGFGLRVKPSGMKSYILQYRNKGGRSRRFTISRHGVMTPDEARDEARQLLVAIDKGADPASGAKDARSAPTVSSLTERYLSEYAKAHKKPSSVDEDERLIKRRIIPSLGAMKIAEVTRLEITKLHHRLRTTPYEANRTVAVLSKMFNLAELWGLRPDGSNPCRHVRRYKEAKRERFLVEDELARLGAALERMVRDSDLTPAAALAIRLLSLTGCRLSEIIGARWEKVDLEKGLMTLSDTKTGARIVPLGDAALDLLKAQARRVGFICAPTAESRLSISMMEKSWRKVCAQAGLRNARLHDLRHTVGTYTGQGGFNAFTVRDLLGHRTLAMTGRYVQRDNDPLRAAANSVSDRIAKAMNGRQAIPDNESVVDSETPSTATIP